MSTLESPPTIQNACLHHLFELQVARTPAALSLIHGPQRLTYAELNSRANQLAHHLIEQGVGAEALVGILMERSIEMVVSVLAVLKAGAAYVALDPSYPKERLAYVIADSQVEVILTTSVTQASLSNPPTKMMVMDQFVGGDAENPNSTVTTLNLAYLIYTSGSTGNPKGVAIEHRSSVAFLQWVGEVFTPDDLQGVLASTSLCFDLSVFEIFAPLCYGGHLVLVEDALALASLENATDVRLVNTVPSAIRALLQTGSLPASVAVVNLAGEPLSQTLVHELYSLTSVRRVLNLYGPTEDTTYSTWAEIPRNENQKPPIGKAITNTQTYVLDHLLTPLSAMVQGELYLSGNGLARGYLNHPELTAERFVPDPFAQVEGSRMYRTGDVVRQLTDGNLEFLGRCDQQVKLRGYRIELGEIEAMLNSHPAVTECVAALQPAEPTTAYAQQQLIAYLVLSGGSDGLPASELRRFLSQRLPPYMVPAAYVALEKLPLTPSGKIDRNALRSVAELRDERQSEAPVTPDERAVAKIWADVFQREDISVTADFFELGGHSLLAFQIISRLRALGVHLDPQAIFGSPTIRALTEVIRKANLTRHSLSREILRPSLRSKLLPLSFTQQRLWFLGQLEPNNSSYNVPAAIKLDGPLDIATFKRSLNEIVKRHETLRTSFHLHKGLPCQQIAPTLDLKIPVIDLHRLGSSEWNNEARRLAKEDLTCAFSLTRAPLLRTKLLHFDDEHHILLLTTHHIIFDDWSMEVLLRELETLYHAFAAGRPAPLEDLPIQYADFAAWQRNTMSTEILMKQLSYWRNQLNNAPLHLRFPGERLRPAKPLLRGAQESLLIDSSLSEALRAWCRKERVTLFMTLLSSFNILLYGETHQEDLLVGTITAGRDELATEGLIGCFINLIVLRTRMAGNPTFRELLEQVQDVAVQAYANQDLPFDKVVQELGPVRSLNESPVVQVTFGVRHASQYRRLQSSNLRLAPFSVAPETVRFDLTVWIEEEQDGLRALWTYASDLFEANTIRRLHEHYIALLRCVMSNPNVRLADLLTFSDEWRLENLLTNKVSASNGYDQFVRIKPRPITLYRG